jgi:FlaG/FlaF family flagellin (archaellin)
MLPQLPTLPAPKRRLSVGNLTLVLAGIIAVIALVFNVAISTPSGARALVSATTVRPDPHTDFSFNDSAHLPTTMATASSAVVSFHLANHEGRSMTYQYIVLQHATSGDIPITAGTVTLADGGSADETAHITQTLTRQTSRIVVLLADPSKSISFPVVAP